MNMFNVFLLALALQNAPTPAPPVLSTAASPGAMSVQPMQMSGQPLQVGDLPPGTVAVRVIRHSFANNVVGQPVELQVLGVNGLMLEEKTDSSGRATFTGIGVGRTVFARASVDGEPLMSQQFEMPDRGGVRLVLVAGNGAGAAEAHALLGGISLGVSPSPEVPLRAVGGEPASTNSAMSPPDDVARWAASVLGVITVCLGLWWSRRWVRPQASEDS
jgi:hypothetical protein